MWFPTRIDPKYTKRRRSSANQKTIKVQLKSNFEESTIFANKYRGQGKKEESLNAWSFFLPLQVKDFLRKTKAEMQMGVE